MVDRRYSATGCLTALPLTLLTLVGCADWSYERIRLEQPPKEYARVLPADTSRRTALGLCHVDTDRSGRTDAIVVLLTSNRRVAGKLRAEHRTGGWGRGKAGAGYRLEGEIDPELCGFPGSGPLDTLRAISAELTDYRGEKLAVDAHAWIAVGLTRLVQRWPGGVDSGVDSERLREMLDLVPGGGMARIEVDQRGVYHVEYVQGNTR